MSCIVLGRGLYRELDSHQANLHIVSCRPGTRHLFRIVKKEGLHNYATTFTLHESQPPNPKLKAPTNLHRERVIQVGGGGGLEGGHGLGLGADMQRPMCQSATLLELNRLTSK